MSDRMDAVTAREYTDRDGNKKTQWTKIGSAWPTKNGGYSISLDALPLPAMGERGLETRIVLMVPKPRDGQRQSSQSRQSYAEQSGGSYGHQPDDLDGDEVPF